MVDCSILEECIDAEKKFDFALFDEISRKILSQISLSHSKTTEFLVQVLKSNTGLADWLKNGPGVEQLHSVTFTSLNETYTLRDKYLAENLIWLLAKKYPDKKNYCLYFNIPYFKELI
jgi:hypothetical protein